MQSIEAGSLIGWRVDKNLKDMCKYLKMAES